MCFIFSELDNKFMSEENIFEFLDDLQDNFNPDLVICDNLTTSKIYSEKRNAEQRTTADRLKNLAEKSNFALFLIAHTGAEVRENQSRLIDENDIRGSKYITTIVEFFYILQPVWINQNLYQFLKIKKHRGQDLNHSLYFLCYAKAIKAFEKDMAKNYTDFIEMFKQRNKLT